MTQRDYEVQKRLNKLEKKIKQDEEIISICGLILTIATIAQTIIFFF